MNDLIFAVQPMSGAAIESDASEILKRFAPHRLTQPGDFDVLSFFDHVLPNHFGLDTGVKSMPYGVEGQAWPDGRILVSESTYDSACDGEGRARFTIAHECYHGIKHVQQLNKVLIHAGEAVLYRKSSIPPYRDPEWQANRFAASLLMPQPMVKLIATSHPKINVIETIMRTFKVSNTAARIRAGQIMKV